MRKEEEVLIVPEFSQANIETVWGGRMRADELETAKDLYNIAKEMGLIAVDEIEFNQHVLNLSLSGMKNVRVSKGNYKNSRKITYDMPNEVSA